MKNITILDGGMGRELSVRGVPFKQPEWSALALYEAPDAVQAVHEDFIRAGAEVITTNSYAVVPFHIGEARFAKDALRLAALSAQLAHQAVIAVGASGVRVAGCLPPLFGSYRLDLFNANEVERLARPLIDGQSDWVDLWLLETQGSIAEANAVLSLLPADNKPIWVAYTIDDENDGDSPTLRSGEAVADAVKDLLDKSVTAALFNCANPEVMNAAVIAAHDVIGNSGAALEIGVYANAFVPQPREADANESLSAMREDLSPQEYLKTAQQWVSSGATIIGGCCGISPLHIHALAQGVIIVKPLNFHYD